MRLSGVYYVLLASICIAVATNEHTRTKRDFSFLKKFIASKLFGASQVQQAEPEPVLVSDDGNIKIFRIPGFEEILVKAVPKKPETEVPIPIEVVEKDPRLTILESYLGTKTPEQTLAALQAIKNLLGSDIVNIKQETIETTNPKEPVYVLPPIVVQEPPKISVTKPIPTTHPGMPKVAEEHPLEYLYQQQHKDGSMMDWYSKDGKEVIVSESNEAPPLPKYILDRLQVVYGDSLVSEISPPGPAFESPKPELDEELKLSSNINGEETIVITKLPLDEKKTETEVPVTLSSNEPSPLNIDVTLTSVGATQAAAIPSRVTVNKYTINQNDLNDKTYVVNNLPERPVSVLKRPIFSEVPTKSGYTYTLVNDKGFYQNRNGKVFYSHLLKNPHDYAPTPTWMHSKHFNENPNEYYLEKAKPLYDTKGEVYVTINKKTEQVDTDSTRQDMYSYNKINGDGTTQFSSDVKLQKPTVCVTESIEKIPALPSFLFERIDEAAAIAHSTRFPKIPFENSYKIITNKNADHIDKPRLEITQMTHPTAGVRVNGASKFEYTQIKSDGSSTTYVGKEDDEKTSPAVLTNQDKSTQTTMYEAGIPATVNEGKVSTVVARPGTVIFTKPVISRYMYKQISRNSQEPFTVVKIEEPSLNQGNRAFKLKWHEHVNMDGSKYMCPFGDIHTKPYHNQQIISRVPKEYIYVPPLDVVEPLPEGAIKSSFSYRQMSSQDGYNYNHKEGSAQFEEKTEKATEATIDTTTSDSAITSWSSEPIVVDEQVYSDKQNSAGDGAPMDVGDKTTVSIQMNQSETTMSVDENLRGDSDMPEASS